MLTLARIFQDGMTLQRQKPIKIWGRSDRAQTLAFALNGEVLAHIEADGDFCVTLPPHEAMTGAALTVDGAIDNVVIRNVDVGEVWIAGGQSNMEYQLMNDAEAEAETPTAEDAHIRFYDYPNCS